MGGKTEKERERKRKEKEKKERKKERKERRKEGKERRREGGMVAGHDRWSPAAAGGGRRRPESGSPSPSNHGGASLDHLKNLEFCKRDFGERSNSSLERARRGEEDGMVVGGQGGVCGGGEGGEGGGGNGLSWWKKEKKDGVVVDVMVVVIVGMEEEMEGRMVEKLVEMVEERVAGQGKHHGWFLGAVGSFSVGGKKEEKNNNERERKEEVLYSIHLTKNCVLAISIRGKMNTKR